MIRNILLISLFASFSLVTLAQRVTISDFGVAYHFGAYNKVAIFGEELLLRPSIQKHPKKAVDIASKLGIAYFYLGDYNRGIDQLDWCIKYMAENKIVAKQELIAYETKGNILLELGQNIQAQEAFRNAIDYYQKNQKEFRKDSALVRTYVSALTNIARTTFATEDYHATQQFSQKAIRYIKEMNLNAMDLLAQNQLCASITFDALGDFEAGKKSLQQALFSIKVTDQYNSLDWAFLFQELATLNFDKQDWKEALHFNQLALAVLLPEWNKEQLPSINELISARSLSMVTQVLAQKGSIEQHIDDETSLKTAIKTYQLLDILLARLRRLYTDESAQLLWSKRGLSYYENAIKTAILLYQKTKDNRYNELAFEFSERSKSSLLLGAFQKIKAQKIADIPDNELNKEKTLKKDYDEVRSEVDAMKRTSFLSKEELQRLEQAKAELQIKKQAYEAFILRLQKQYPAYYKLKYNLNVISVKEIQARLDQDQLMIEYFVANDELIIFKIGKNSFDVLEIRIAYDLPTAITDFRNSIYNYFLGEDRTKEARDKYTATYTRLGHQLYQTLLKPALKDATQKRLTIILAGHLGFLPFEALLTQPTNESDFRELPYVLQDYSLAYCYSATLLREMQDKPHVPKKIFLGFAPTFDKDVILEDKYTFEPLQYSQKEVTEVFDLVNKNGEFFDGPEATKENFQQTCEEYCIVHIATHGVMNSNNSENSFLAFSEVKDSTDNELLYVKELYNMHFSADLVVLSACETGIGELLESEGIASLARGFSYAGAKSIITSLWAVNDYATAEIMKALYKNLNKGQTKDQALRKAKLNLVNNSASALTAHPFLWSAFIHIGSEAPLPSPKKEKKGNFLLGIFGAMHWCLIGIIILSALWAGLKRLLR